MPYTTVRAHARTRRGRRYRVGSYRRRTVGSLARGRTGEKFKKLAREVTREYVKKSYPRKEAEKIGEATAGKVFWKKFGKAGGARILRRER